VLEQFLFDGVAVEPGDRAQPPSDRGASPAAGLHLAAEALDVGATRLEQMQPVLLAPSSEHAQVQRVGVAGQAAVAGEKPDECCALGLGERFDRNDKLGRRDGGGHGDLLSSGRNPPLEAGAPAANDRSR
jgi:hypothetical protein